MAAAINALPYLALKAIFTRLPLVDQLRLHKVCRLWAWYQTEILQQHSHLTLLLGMTPEARFARRAFISLDQKWLDTAGTSATSQPHLRFLNLTRKTAISLTTHLPAINHLTVVINGIDCQIVDQLQILLQSWSSSLRVLKLYIAFAPSPQYFHNHSEIAYRYLILLGAINILPALTHLTFDVDPPPVENHNLPVLEFTFLSRLREFYFSSQDNFLGNLVSNSLKKYATTNNRLEHIEIANGQFIAGLSQFASELPQVALKFRKLNYINYRIFSENPRLFSHFPNLTQLDLNWFNVDFTKLLSAVAPLKSLKILSVHFIENLPLTGIDSIAQTRLPSLSSVRSLIIWAYGSNPNDLNCRHWGHIFPTIESLQLHHFPADYKKRKTAKQVLAETATTLQTFTQCSDLQSIYSFEHGLHLKQRWIVVNVKDKRIILKV